MGRVGGRRKLSARHGKQAIQDLGDAGFVLDIPGQYTLRTRVIPTEAEIEPWVETILRLWDDPHVYPQASTAARDHAQGWHPDNLAPQYQEFFANITHQPGPPLVPKEVMKAL